MNKKFLFVGGTLCAAAIIAVILIHPKNFIAAQKSELKPTEIKQTEEEKDTKQQAVPQTLQAVNQTKQVNKPVQTKKISLQNFEINNSISLSSVIQIEELPENIKEIVYKQIDDCNFYYISKHNDSVKIIKDSDSENEQFARHDFEIITISLSDGKVEREINYPRVLSNEISKSEVWEYEVLENQAVVPSVHKSLNKDGSVKYTEFWNYSADNDIKYKLLDKKGKVTSLRKTSKNNDGSWRDEHIFYDENEKTAVNITTCYENNNIARFTYYNAENPEEGFVISNEYSDGEKVNEKIYTSDYKLINTFLPAYDNGSLKEIKVLDKENNLTKEFLTE